jgi:hypothetical protein
MSCFRSVANLSKNKPFYFLDDPTFTPEILKEESEFISPKLTALFKKISELDRSDMENHGRKFKHMIFTDLSQSMSIRLLSSALIANSFTPCFNGEYDKGISMKMKSTLQKTKGKNFGVLASRPIFGVPVSAEYKRSVLRLFNSRGAGGNNHGKYIRFMILDNGFKEGIDLYDVKYVHLFEPLMFEADQKQAVGRATRFCGQKGIQFIPQKGWELSVFIYDVNHNGKKLSDLYLKAIQFNFSLMKFASELDSVVQEAAVDKLLMNTENKFVTKGPLTMMSPGSVLTFEDMQMFIKSHFWNKNFVYNHTGLINKCKGGSNSNSQIVKFTPSQNFISHFFTPESVYKGMLLYHSVGSGKTCTAIATATNSFDRENYTILWVTRHTLKADIWKNMFKQICHINFRERIKQGEKIKASSLSKNWIQPISYKQFSNLLNGKNKVLEEKLISRNGREDMLHKTLVIIDEAHKLYADSVAAAEKPNMMILEKMINNSYKLSGKDSVKLLLMTATPYTENPFEMIKLLNLLRQPDDKLETQWEPFSRKYLQENGSFRNDKKGEFLDKISGYISYLNKSSDKRLFAYPTFYHVIVDSTKKPILGKKENKYLKSMKNLRQEKKEVTNRISSDYIQKEQECKIDCNNIKNKLDKINCNDPNLSKSDKKVCKEQYKEIKEKLKICKSKCKDLTSDKRSKINSTKESTKLEISKVKEEYEHLKYLRLQLREDILKTRDTIKNIKHEMLKNKMSKKTSKNKHLNLLKKRLRSSILLNIHKINAISTKIGTRYPQDLSQESALIKCDKSLSESILPESESESESESEF